MSLLSTLKSQSRVKIMLYSMGVALILIGIHFFVLRNTYVIYAFRNPRFDDAVQEQGFELWQWMSFASFPILVASFVLSTHFLQRPLGTVDRFLVLVALTPVFMYLAMLTPFFIGVYDVLLISIAIIIVLSLLISIKYQHKSLSIASVCVNILWLFVFYHYLSEYWELYLD